MADRLQVYRCDLCGNIVEVLDGGMGELVCCGKAMILMKENTVDAAKEKHVPVIGQTDHGIKVSVGNVPHPMQEEHFIEWIQVIADGKAYREFLKPGDAPEATFCIDAKTITAREYCNLHGHWRS